MTASLTRFSVCAVLIAVSLGHTAEFAPLFPFLLSYDAPDNVVNMSHLVPAPAGKDGFVSVKNEHFATERGRIRFNGTNLTGPANFPTQEQADMCASRLARFGINCVRLHFFDAQYSNFMTAKEGGIFGNSDNLPAAYKADPQQSLAFDSQAVARQDYLIAALKKHGIYVNVNLHVARFEKMTSFFRSNVMAAEKEYALKLLQRLNPYTGLTMAQDPCVAMIEINNENALFSSYAKGLLENLAPEHAIVLQREWNSWLRKKYPNTTVMHGVWQWPQHSLGIEQIENGQFDQPLIFDSHHWIFAKSTVDATAKATNGVLVVHVKHDGHASFPKLIRRTILKKGESYTLSFKVRRLRGSGNATLALTVGDSPKSGRILSGINRQIKTVRDWQEHSYSFVAMDSSDQAEIRISRFNEGEYQIDDFSLRRGATKPCVAMGNLEESTLPIIKMHDSVPQQAKDDFIQFLWDIEQAYWQKIAHYLKDKLQVKVPISGTQLGYSPPQLQSMLDYVDNHAYWCHPTGYRNWSIRNEAMVNSLSTILSLATQRVDGKPYTISEYNHPFPNQYGAEGQPILCAYGAMQGWDAVFQYTYNHTTNFEPSCNSFFYSMIARTEVLAHLPACAAIYLRGDVHESPAQTISYLNDTHWHQRLLQHGVVATDHDATGQDPLIALTQRVGMQFYNGANTNILATNKELLANTITSDTGQLIWHREHRDKAYWCVNTPNTKLFTGFSDGQEIVLDDVSVTPGNTRLGWATISLISKDANGFGGNNRAANILLAATGTAQNEGTELITLDREWVTLKNRLHWGSGAVLVEGVPATIKLPATASHTRCYALNERGNRKAEVPVIAHGSGCRLTIGPHYQTVWYEIEVASNGIR